MWGLIEINDTLQITKKQGFPGILNYEEHLKNPFLTQQFEGEVFEFFNKPKLRVYKAPPVRNFLVENIDGKWLYWGLIHVLEETHDMENKTTSWRFKIIHIYSPEEMLFAHRLIDRNIETDYLGVME